MYSIKKHFKNYLLENSKIESALKLQDNSLFKYSEGIFVGKFDNNALSLWHEKDGNGGRGEYTVASHFLKSSINQSTARGLIKKENFFKKIGTNINVLNKSIFENSNTSEEIYTTLQNYISEEFNSIIKITNSNYTPSTDGISKILLQLKNNPEEIRLRSKAFKIRNQNGTEHYSTWGTILRYLNRIAFLKEIESQIKSQGSIYDENDIYNYDLITSVTTSGKEAKSTDVVISNNRIKQEFKTLLNLGNNDLSIEVKEISSATSTTTGAGIRLASGSRLESLKNDIIFSLTIICIVIDIDRSTRLGVAGENQDGQLIEDEILDILTSFKENQIASSKLSRLIEILSDESICKKLLESLEAYVGYASGGAVKKREIGLRACDHLSDILLNQTSSQERSDMINDSFSGIIDGSINAEYFCILNGRKGEDYNSSDKKFGKKEFLLIHKSRYKDVLGLSSYQNGGTAYAGIRDKEVAELLINFFGNSANESLKRNISLYEKRQKYINTLKKEFLSHKKEIISEGGKAGHMMHPYENLHLKISEMKEMISDFQNDFEISEKVDGGNLFFTVNSDSGQILFSRNKKDMTHEETLEKFGPGHGGHRLFTDGANSVYNAVKSALNRSDINQIFGQSPEGGKTYINFEIMHPKKVIQIRYDMKYIVLHAIVDFDMNGEKVSSSPDDPRLMLLINKLQPYFATQDNDFNLGSNFKVKLNKLSKKDIEELNLELNKVTSKLGLDDNMTIADGVKYEIKTLLDQNNLTEILSDDKVEMIYNFITDENSGITGNQIKKDLDKETKKMLSSLGLTSKTKAYGIIKKVTKEFRKLFLLLGIKLLHNVQSRYMSKEAGALNVDELRRLLTAALEDYDNLVSNPNPSEFETKLINKMSLHVANIRDYGIENAISSPVEGGVFIGKDGNTYKVTGGYGPLNQILGTAFFNIDYMPAFKAERKLQGRD